jgi:hypothetical protein
MWKRTITQGGLTPTPLQMMSMPTMGFRVGTEKRAHPARLCDLYSVESERFMYYFQTKENDAEARDTGRWHINEGGWQCPFGKPV